MTDIQKFVQNWIFISEDHFIDCLRLFIMYRNYAFLSTVENFAIHGQLVLSGKHAGLTYTLLEVNVQHALLVSLYVCSGWGGCS